MKFTKMQGCGNDYIYINCFEENITDPSETALRVSERHFGVGSDGLICIHPSERADFRMEMYNADGSRGQMCGNGIRCVGKYVYDSRMTDKEELTVETPAGIKTLKLNVIDGRVASVRVNMGSPVFEPQKIPVLIPGYGEKRIMNEPIAVTTAQGRREFLFSALSMGNPHAVIRVEDVSDVDLEKLGPLFERHSYFPERVNTEFISITDEGNIKMRVWERGSGETLACGTGACAAAVLSFLNGWTKPEAGVHLKGGRLDIEYDVRSNTVYMTGPAQTICTGDFVL